MEGALDISTLDPSQITPVGGPQPAQKAGALNISDLNPGDITPSSVPKTPVTVTDQQPETINSAATSAAQNFARALTTPSGITQKMGVPGQIAEPVVRGISATGALTGGLFDVGTKIVENMIPQGLRDAISEQVKGSPIGEIYETAKPALAPILDKVKSSIANGFQDDPQGLQTATNLLNVALLGWGMTSGAPEAAEKGAAEISGKVASIPEKMQAASEAAATEAKSKALTTAEKEWTDELNSRGGKIEKIANKADIKGQKIGQDLANQGITAESVTDVNGKYDTGSAVAKLRAERQRLYDTSLGTLIEKADTNGTTIDLDKVMRGAIKYADNSYAASNDIESVISKIKKAFGVDESGVPMENGSRLSNLYGDEGIPVGEAESQKTAHWREVNWSPIVNRGTANNLFDDAMGHGYQSEIETALENENNLPKGTIGDMNKEIGKMHNNEDFLQSLDGKKPVYQPAKGLGGKIMSGAIRVGAAGAAKAAGPVGEFAGYMLSKPLAEKLTDLITSMPAAMRTNTLRNMEAEEPAVYKQIVDAINEAENPKESLPPLGNEGGAASGATPPEPSGPRAPVGTESSPHNTPPLPKEQGSIPEPIKQPSADLNRIYKEAPDVKTHIDKVGQDIADKVGGTLSDTKLKDFSVAEKKVIREKFGDASLLHDVARNTIVAPDVNSYKQAIDLLNSHPDTVKLVTIAPGEEPLGYAGTRALVKAPNGYIGEIQINTPEMIYGKESAEVARQMMGDEQYNKIKDLVGIPGGKGHKYYEMFSRSDFELGTDRALEIAAKSNGYYDAIRAAAGKIQSS